MVYTDHKGSNMPFLFLEVSMFRRVVSLLGLLLGICVFFVPSSMAILEKKPMKMVDYILVEKKKRRMTLFSQNKKLREYQIALGFNPVGHKQKKGDGKTPEGIYTIAKKNPNSAFYRTLKISYPNDQDRAKARSKGVSPGGDIMIHGLKHGRVGKKHLQWDWTHGCMALTNEEMREIYDSTRVGTVIEIRP